MKRKIHKILGVTLTLVMVLTLAVAFSPIPALANPDEEAWEIFDIPVVGLAGDYFMDNTIIGMGPFAKAIDGTLYLYVAGGAPLGDLYKSEDDGRTWEVTDYVADGCAVPIVDIACSSIDADILYVASPTNVWKSDDAGAADSWVEVGEASLANQIAGVTLPADAWAGTELITSVDVGYIDEKPYVYIGSADPGAYNGDVYYIGDYAFGGDWVRLQVDDGAVNNTLDVYSVNVSPFFEDDTEVDALVTDATPYTAAVRNTTSIPGEWSEQAELQLTGVTAFEAGWSTDIHYVADFDEEDEMFVGVVNAAALPAVGDVFRICGEGCCLDLGIDDDIIGLDVVGSFGSTSLVAGTFGTPASIWYSTNDGDDWDEADKVPTGTGATSNQVILDDDFADSGISWCASDAVTEGAVSLTTDFGATWNGISMIDTDMAGAVYDVAFSPDYGSGDAPMFMVTESSVAVDDSVWKYDSTNWERVWYDAANALDLVEVSPGYADDTAVFIADSGVPVILYSHDGGAEFTEMTEQPIQPIASWVVIDDETIITGSDGTAGTAGEVYKTTRYGRRCFDEYDTGGGLVVTDLAVNGDTVLAGDAGSLVHISTDLGEEWDELSDSDLTALVGVLGATYVAFDIDYATNDTIYAASDDIIARCEIDPDEDMADQEFDDMGALDGFAAASGLVVSEDGTLYAADATAVALAAAAAVAGVPAVPAVVADSFVMNLGATAVLGNTVTISMTSGAISLSALGNFTAAYNPGTGIYLLTVVANGAATATITTIAGPAVGIITNVSGVAGIINVLTDADVLDDSAVQTPIPAAAGAQGTFSLIDAAVSGVPAVPGVLGAVVTGGVNRCLNPTDDTADIVWELPLDGFGVGGQTLAGIGVNGTVSNLSLTAGSNILWAIDTTTALDIWTYEDTLAAPVVLTSPGNKSSVDSEDEVAFTWEDLNVDTVEFYTLELNEYDDFSGPDLGATLIDDNDWSTGADALDSGTTYYWRVTVTDPVSSRTSAEWSFITKVAQVTAPVEVRPLPGAQDVILLPTFAWRPVTGAATYEILVATDAGFTSVVTSASTLINAWEIDVELDYSTVYYWRVRGISASGAPAGDWVISVFTTMAKPTVTPPVEITQITQPAPIVEITKTEITPAWIWAIIAIGAVLCVAVVILIVRTRRAV